MIQRVLSDGKRPISCRAWVAIILIASVAQVPSATVLSRQASSPEDSPDRLLEQLLRLQLNYWQMIDTVQFHEHATTEALGGTSHRYQESRTLALAGDQFYWMLHHVRPNLGRPATLEVMFDGERYLSVDSGDRVIAHNGTFNDRGFPLSENMLCAPFSWAEIQGEEFSARAMRRADFWDSHGFRVSSRRNSVHRGHSCIEVELDTSARSGAESPLRHVTVHFAEDLQLYPIRQEYFQADSQSGQTYNWLSVDVTEHQVVESDGNRVVIPTRVERVFRTAPGADGEPVPFSRDVSVLLMDQGFALNEPIDPARFTTSLNRPGYLLMDVQTRRMQETDSTSFAQHEAALMRDMGHVSGETRMRILDVPRGETRARRFLLWGTLGLFLIGVGVLLFVVRH